MGKRWWLMALLIAVLPAYAGPFTDFRIPIHRTYSLWGDFSGGYSDFHANEGGYSANNWQYSGRLSGNGSYLYDSDPLRAAVSLNASTQGNRSRVRSENVISAGNYSHHGDDAKNVSEYWNVNGDLRYFPWQLPLGFTASGSGGGSYSQQWQSGNSDSYLDVNQTYDQRRQHASTWEYYYSVSVSGGVGWGRVRDASVVYLVHIAEARLQECGALTRELTPATREKLAALWYFGKDMGQVHDRYGRFYWDEFERILRADGALKDGLDAYSLYRIAEPVFGGNVRSVSNPNYMSEPPLRIPRGSTYSSFPRYQGYFIGVTASEYHTHSIRRYDGYSDENYQTQDTSTYDFHQITETHSHMDQSQDNFAVGPRAEYRLPWGWRWQFDLNSAVLFPFNDHPHAIQANSSVSASYLIVDRWYGQCRFYHMRSLTRDENTRYVYGEVSDYSTWQTNAQASLTYFVEDHLSLTLALEQQQYVIERDYFEGIGYSHWTHQFTRNHTVSLGLSYHFLGQLDAPILSAPVKMLPVEWPF